MAFSARSKRQLKMGIYGTIFTICFYLFVLVLPQLMTFLGYQTYRIPSGSMRPNILVNEYILTKKVNQVEEFEAGDVIVFSFSAQTALDFKDEENSDCRLDLHRRLLVKRIIAMPHDIIEFKGGQIMVNGITISYIGSATSEGLNNGRRYAIIPQKKYRKLMTRINEGYVFVLGDNRMKSADSRCWGEVPISAIKGRVSRILYSKGEDGIRWSRVWEKVK